MISHLLSVNPLFAALKPQSNGPSYSSSLQRSVHWPLMSGLLHLVQRGGDWAGSQPLRPLLAVPNVTAHPSTSSVPTSYYLMWHYNCLWFGVKGLNIVWYWGTEALSYCRSVSFHSVFHVGSRRRIPLFRRCIVCQPAPVALLVYCTTFICSINSPVHHLATVAAAAAALLLVITHWYRSIKIRPTTY